MGKIAGTVFRATGSKARRAQFIIATSSFANITGLSHQLRAEGHGGSQQRYADSHASFGPIASGTVYAAYIMNFQYDGADKWCGLSFMTIHGEMAFIGEISSGRPYAWNRFLWRRRRGSRFVWLNNGMGNDYLIVAATIRISRASNQRVWKTDTFRSIRQRNGAVVATAARWDALNSIDGIRLGAGGNTPGELLFR
jgi:hypothetical protein